MRVSGTITAAAGAVAMIAFMALVPYIQVAGGSGKIWDLSTRLPVILTVLAVAVIVLVVVSIFVDSFLLPLFATCVAFYLFGQWSDLSSMNYSIYAAGYWLVAAATIAMSVGGVLAAVAAWRERGLALPASAPAAVWAPAPATAPAPPSPATPPAGWYRDPSGQSRQRYWSGTEWTAQVR